MFPTALIENVRCPSPSRTPPFRPAVSARRCSSPAAPCRGERRRSVQPPPPSFGWRRTGRIRVGRKCCRKGLKRLNPRPEMARPLREPTRVHLGEFHFLIWVARNPLKSLKSDEGIQENPSPFSWTGLVLFGLAWVRLGGIWP